VARSLRGLVAPVERERLADGRGGGGCHPGPPAAAALSGRRGGRCRPGPPAGLRGRALGCPEGIGSLDETGFLGTLTSAASRGHGFLDRGFSLPEAWGPGASGQGQGPRGGRLPDQAGARHRPAGARLGAGDADAWGHLLRPSEHDLLLRYLHGGSRRRPGNWPGQGPPGGSGGRPCGVRINPTIVEGQMQGGLCEGWGIAFTEQITPSTRTAAASGSTSPTTCSPWPGRRPSPKPTPRSHPRPTIHSGPREWGGIGDGRLAGGLRQRRHRRALAPGHHRRRRAGDLQPGLDGAVCQGGRRADERIELLAENTRTGTSCVLATVARTPPPASDRPGRGPSSGPTAGVSRLVHIVPEDTPLPVPEKASSASPAPVSAEAAWTSSSNLGPSGLC
jgi:hypothetical protein